jgi:hypothetical protein
LDDWPLAIPRPAVRDKWVLWSEEPVAMRWSSSAGAETTTIVPERIEFAELAVLWTHAARLHMSAVRPEEVLGGAEVTQSNGRHRWEFDIGGDRVEAQRHVIEFVIDGRNFISQVALVGAPKSFEDHRLLRLLQGSVENEESGSATEEGHVEAREVSPDPDPAPGDSPSDRDPAPDGSS